MDLSTHYLGMTLRSPLIASSSPLTLDVDAIRALEDGGAGAVILPSIFQEQIEWEEAESERFASFGANSQAEAASYFPATSAFSAGAERHLEVIARAREAVDIPIIASLNGIDATGWTSYAKLIEQAGANAIELNVYLVAADPAADPNAVEQIYIDALTAVKKAVTLPVSLKLSPYFTAMAAMVRRLDDAGADGFSLFNRFYQPDIDLPTLSLRRDLALSTAAEIRLPLLWIGALRGHIRGSLAATTGVETADEVVKYLLAGADVVMTASALLRHGVGHMAMLRYGLEAWLEARDLSGPADIRGQLSMRRAGDSKVFERANYISILQGWRPPARR